MAHWFGAALGAQSRCVDDQRDVAEVRRGAVAVGEIESILSEALTMIPGQRDDGRCMPRHRSQQLAD